MISLIDPLSGRHCHMFLLSPACELLTEKKSFWTDFSEMIFKLFISRRLFGISHKVIRGIVLAGWDKISENPRLASMCCL